MKVKITGKDGREFECRVEARGNWVAIVFDGITVGEGENLRDAIGNAETVLFSYDIS